MNWLDIAIAVILLVTTILGIVKGLVKQVIGLAAVVAGLILAALYYQATAGIFAGFIDNPLLANFLGFLLIFIVVLVAGSILSHLITKAMKGPLALINRAFGGVFGLVKAVLICGVLVFALLTFDVAKPALEGSTLAPVCLGITRAVVNLIPQDLMAKFNASYKEIRERGGKRGEKI